MSHAEFHSNWSATALARTLFLETDIDLAAPHAIRIYQQPQNNADAHVKAALAVSHHPQRFLPYVAVEPDLGPDAGRRLIDRELDSIPGAVGMTLHLAADEPSPRFRLDDEGAVFPLLEHAQQRGIKTVAVHHAAWAGLAPTEPHHLRALDSAAKAFPQLSFETALPTHPNAAAAVTALATRTNVHFRLESVTGLLMNQPAEFERVLCGVLRLTGPGRLLYSDACMVTHSQPILRRLVSLQLSDDACARYDLKKLTHTDKRMILGENYARIIGFDLSAAKDRIIRDRFAEERDRSGRWEPYLNWRSEFRGSAVRASRQLAANGGRQQPLATSRSNTTHPNSRPVEGRSYAIGH
ncbi:hypothetical protein SAMN06265360_1416 [Haloechinothrix alba]|uniref:Amidohydrolase-related domain-containing protein n=2 Tax=Haloechinothrix alba TaxID=664784 RepID=A0A239AJ80_9PSEU|nr:hypothetical protein SAMN06265360_1416 [Haloechinothrix alba]